MLDAGSPIFVNIVKKRSLVKGGDKLLSSTAGQKHQSKSYTAAGDVAQLLVDALKFLATVPALV